MWNAGFRRRSKPSVVVSRSVPGAPVGRLRPPSALLATADEPHDGARYESAPREPVPCDSVCEDVEPCDGRPSSGAGAAAPAVSLERADFDRALGPLLGELRLRARRLTGTYPEAEDLVQEAVMRAWRAWRTFEAGTNARAWAHRILFNTFVKGYHRDRRERRALNDHAADEGQRQLERASRDAETRDAVVLGAAVEEALESLPEEFQEVVRMIDVGEHSYREAAERLGCPIGTVMSRLHRGRSVLRSRLAGYARGGS